MMGAITLDEPGAYFDRLAAFEADHWWSTALWRIADGWIDAMARGCRSLDALDVGCGAGLTLARLAARTDLRRVIGVEPSREAIRHARRRGDFGLVTGSALNLPFRSGSFDVVTCLDVIQHLPAEGSRLATSEIARVLRPGGIAIVRSNAERDSIQGLKRVFDNEPLRVLHATHVNLVGSLFQEVRGRLRPAKFRPHPSGGGLPPERHRGWIDRAMAVVGIVEASLVGRLRVRLPFGHSVMLLASKRES